MSFLKISDPLKRDAIVKEYLELKKKIRSNLLSERIGESELQTDLSKFYRPITETQKATAREITEELKPIREGIEKLPEAIQPLGKATEEEEEEEEGYFSPKVLDELYRFKGKRDELFGINRKKDNYYYLGNKIISVDDNNIITVEKSKREFKGTPGMWELIMSKNPTDYTYEDFKNYKDLMTITNAIYRNDNPKEKHPKPANNDKWKYIVGPIWYMNKGFNENDAFKMAKDPGYKKTIIRRMGRRSRSEEKYEGEGVVVIPSDPNALLERLDLLLASQEAGHTGVRNELISICDELKRQDVLDTKAYKKLNHLIKK